MRVLFLTRFDFTETQNDGGVMCAYRNYNTLLNIYGDKNVIVCILTPKSKTDYDNIHYFKSTDNILLTYLTYIHLGEKYTFREKNRIIKFILGQGVDKIFFDGSTFGQIIKNSSINKIDNIVFFHNVERQYAWDQVRNHSIFCIIRYFSAGYNERLMSKFSRKIICLNTRDQKLIKKYYKTDVDMIWPITLEDCFHDVDIFDSENHSSQLELLYVGSYLAHNYTGLTWFIENVMPFVNARLTIIGKKMENLRDKISAVSNVDIIGTVEELQSYYTKADAVVMPIFMGGGMKVKTAEALMYGKNIFASKEALEGYDIAGIEGIYICDTAEKFIEKINLFFKKKDRNKFNANIRQLFINKYCTEHYFEDLKKLLLS